MFFSPYDGKRLVKRVIGLPGDTVEMHNDVLVLNGESLAYQAIDQKLLRDVAATDLSSHVFAHEQLPGRPHSVAAYPAVQARRDFGPLQVPAGQYFMMGDNRDDSFDSRYWGTVERSRIVGRATTVVLSFDRQRYWAPRWDRFFTAL